MSQQSPDQTAYRAGYSTEDHLLTVTLITELCSEWRSELWLGLIDFEKAFGCVECHASPSTPPCTTVSRELLDEPTFNKNLRSARRGARRRFDNKALDDAGHLFFMVAQKLTRADVGRLTSLTKPERGAGDVVRKLVARTISQLGSGGGTSNEALPARFVDESRVPRFARTHRVGPERNSDVNGDECFRHETPSSLSSACQQNTQAIAHSGQLLQF